MKTTLAQRKAAKKWYLANVDEQRRKGRERQAKKLRDPGEREKHRAALRGCYHRNKATYLEHNRRYRRKPNAKIADRLRSLLRGAMKNAKSSKITELLGCSLVEFRAHIERQFVGGMTWENYGTFWTLDHIKACAKFDLTTLEGRKECFHYSNTRPLLKVANQVKHSQPWA